MTQRSDTQAWVRGILAHLRLKPTELARAIGKAPSTLNRFLNDPAVEHDLSKETIGLIAAFAKVKPFELPPAGPRRPAGFSAPEGVDFSETKGTGDLAVDDAVRAMLKVRNSLASWVLRSPALVGAGYLPGDVLFVDLNERARPHDVVCAQVYDWTRGSATTVFRIFEPPYLLAPTVDPALSRPLVVDDDMVSIKGVVTTSLRPRRALEAAA